MNAVDDWIKEVGRRGLILNNLFQFKVSTTEWRWQANVTDGVRYWDFGRGATPQEALSQALFKSESTTPEIVLDRPIRATPPKVRPSAEPIDSSMLEDI
jgi:hypothetical protein